MHIEYLPEEGKKFIEYETRNNTITFGDDELSINLAKKERDYDISVDVIRDYSGGLLCSIDSSAEEYVAQVLIPARQYNEEEKENPNYNPSNPESGETTVVRTAVPFDIKNCTLKLYEEV